MCKPHSLAALGLAATVLIPAAAGFGAVSLTFSDKDATPTSTSAPAGVPFVVDVLVNLSAAGDDVDGVDYHMQIDAAGSGHFEIVSRTSNQTIMTVRNYDNTVAPVTLAPTNGTPDLGAFRDDISDLTAVGSYDLAAYTIEALPGTANGTYTLSFVADANTHYLAGPSTNFAPTPFDSVGTFTVTVPEPASLGGAALVLGAGLRRRRVAR